MYNCVWYFCAYLYSLSDNGCHALFCIANIRHGVTIMTHANTRHFLIWMTTVRQPTERLCSCILILKYNLLLFIGERDKEFTTPSLIVVDRYLRLIGDKTIPDSAEPRVESFNPNSSQVSIYRDVVDSYNLQPPKLLRRCYSLISCGIFCLVRGI